MSKQEKRARDPRRNEPSPLGGGRAALFDALEALLSELERFEELATGARRTPLDSQKNLERAVRSLQDALAVQGRIGERLGALIAAIDGVRTRQEATAGALTTRVTELQERADRYGAFGERLAALINDAAEVNALVQVCAAELKDSTAGKGAPPAGRVDAILERMSSLTETAEQLSKDAGADGWTDVERQADSLRQQMLAARNKLLIVRRGMPAKA